MIADLVSGPKYLLQGYRLIFRPGLRRFFLIPILVNVLVFAGLVWLFIDQFEALLDWFLPTADSWWAQLARGLLWFIFAVAASVFLFFTFTLVANLLAAPFNGWLAERVAYVLDKNNMPVTRTDVSLLKSVGLSNYIRVVKLMYFDDAEDNTPIDASLDMRVLIGVNGLVLLLAMPWVGIIIDVCGRAIAGIY